MKKIYFLFFAVLFSFLPTLAFAQTNTNAVNVSPSVISLDLATDKPEATLTYTNNTPTTITLTLSAQNFTELENGAYNLSFLNGRDAANYQYGLSSWIQFSSKTLVVEPNQSEKVTVFVEKDKLGLGGHYATILASVDQDNPTNKPVVVKSILASLLFVRTHNGTENERGSIASFDLERNIFSFPTTISFRFNNSGDVQVTPYGLVQITDSSNKVVAKGIANDASAMTIPQSVRRYFVPIKNLESFLFPGFYTVSMNLHFGDTNKKIQYKQTFFSEGSVPFEWIAPLLLLILGAVIFFKRKRTKKSQEK